MADSEMIAFTLKALKNSGVDTECGACMEVAFTGVTTNQHTCQRDTAVPVVTFLDIENDELQRGKLGALDAIKDRD